MQELNKHILGTAKTRIKALEKQLGGDAILYFGEIVPGIDKVFRDFIETLKRDRQPKNRLLVILRTPGGSAETVEKLVEIIRFHYEEIYFIVPDEAMSAGTIFCMSGDRIYMDYSSSLGPIDPQIHNGNEWVPALGYLDQVERMIKKSADNELTDAELIILQNLDLAMLSKYEQAKNLTITLLKRWLVEYKFKSWETHHSNPEKLDQEVTLVEKEERAEEIAELLSKNKLWHSHGRKIGSSTLTRVLKLKIDDYSNNEKLRQVIRNYHDFITEFLIQNGIKIFIHSRKI